MKYIDKLEYWQSQEGPHRALCKFAGAMFKLYKSRSKFTVKVTCFKWKGMDIKNTYAKYERLIVYSKTVMANVQN